MFYDENMTDDNITESVVETEKSSLKWLPKDDIIEALQSERNFYFSKLRELEILMKDSRINEPVREAVCSILKQPENAQNKTPLTV